MKHTQLKALVAVADHGSIRSAARALFLTQPAVTRMIHDLEGEVGLPLLVRKSRGVVLTEEGKVVLTRARMIVREFERVQDDINMLKGSRGGRLNIGVTPLAGLTVLPRAFMEFRKAWPDIELNFFEFSADQIYDNLRNGNLDFALGGTMEDRQSHSSRIIELISLPTSFAIRHDSVYANCRSLAELRQVEWLHTDLTGHFGLFLSELFAREGLPPPARVTRCTSQALFYSLSMMADVVIYWSKLALTSRVLSQQFHTLDFGVELPHLKLNLMLREDGLMTRSGEYFINCVREIVAEDIRRLKQS